jgi:hypothetical protein
MLKTAAAVMCFALSFCLSGAKAAELVLPDNRNAYYASEPVEIAVAGLDRGATATVEIAPDGRGLAPLRFRLTGDGSTVRVTASLKNLKMPWPLTVTVTSPDMSELYRVYRAPDATGRYTEAFPLGSNARPGVYSVHVEGVGNPNSTVQTEFRSTMAIPKRWKERVRVFGGEVIRRFLAGKPEIVIAVGSEAQRPVADGLAKALLTKGIRAKVVSEREVIRRARYPRVWDPYIRVYVWDPYAEQPEKIDASMNVRQTCTLETAADGSTTARTADGRDLGDAWRAPGTLATVAGQGFIDFAEEQFYEAGCKLYVNDNGGIVVAKGQPAEVAATEEARRKWSRPWTKLSSYVGTDKLCPQLPEAYSIDSHLILLGDSAQSELTAALQASDLLLQTADAKYPGPGKALISFAWSPFALGKNVILIGASDEAGLRAGAEGLVRLAGK